MKTKASNCTLVEIALEAHNTLYLSAWFLFFFFSNAWQVTLQNLNLPDVENGLEECWG